MARVVWHRRDLKTVDNRALTEAGEEGVPVYIFDLDWLEDDLVWRKESLSSRHDREEIMGKAGKAQSDPEKFT